MNRARRALLVAVCSTLFSAQALAEDGDVTQRLQSHGGLSGAAAKRLSTKVAQRMMKSADTLASPNDPLRVAMSQALFHAAVPPDNMAAAKMRLKLYAGLNTSTLEALFVPKPGAIASCVRAVGGTQAECEALVAAAGRQSVADVRGAAGGPAAVAPTVLARTAPAAPAPAGNARFGKFNSGFQGAAPTYAAAAPSAKPATTQFGAAPRPAAAAPQSGMSRKEAYQAQREAYLARQKALHDERKQKLGAASAGEADAPPAAAAPAAVASAAPAKTAPAAKTKPGAAAAPAEAAAEEAPVEVAKSGPALEGDFLNDLLADPLGKK